MSDTSRLPVKTQLTILLLGLFIITGPLNAQEWPAEPPAEAPADWGPVSINFEEIEYPYPVHYLELNRYGQKMRMAYMDVDIP